MPDGKFVGRFASADPSRVVDHGVLLRPTATGLEMDVDRMLERGMHVPAADLAAHDAAKAAAARPAVTIAEINRKNREFYARGWAGAAGRDADVPVDGTHLGTHPAGFKYNVETNGELSVYNAKEDHVCTYQPGAWHILEDENGVHVGRTGNHDPFKGPELPERLDDARDNSMSILRRMNRANRKFWANRSS